MNGTRSEARILVVDDETALTDLVGLALRYEGFEVASAANGRSALAAAAEFGPDLLVLDVMLPDFDGLEVCARLRAQGLRVPVVFLTARDATEDKITGLTVGGDDYVTKPFSLDELIARIRAVLRRTRPVGEEDSRLGFADLVIDEDAHEARRGGEPMDLTPTEFKLLRFLTLNAGRVMSKAQILDHVWQYDFGGGDNVVETYISYLRKKVDRERVPLIHTVRGVGYSLRLPRDPHAAQGSDGER
ncbi:MAG TPA: response regulator transcription factor [Actinospica sp.]|nr:response regulator transcription factor [Actinospica sp.]